MKTASFGVFIVKKLTMYSYL